MLTTIEAMLSLNIRQLLCLKQYDAAIADYDEAIHLVPDLVIAYNNRGSAKFTLKQYDAAITDYDGAIVMFIDFQCAASLLW